ncbi:hypothetical protein ANANG_G00024650 [Anguilla anguilla]|uniref:Phospholipid/glycerol acyltransferase domain-containing protein n=1 Tax=Anguilla anguilla TaxID=7936 RepID=A0A9D3N2X7_ANGAN|nr:hypothetical protein ANANG_G00024650 [Anguilla anguilla]
MNHRTRLDWMFLWCCLLRCSYLRLEKICLKAALKSVPGFGWAMQVASFIFIHRRWEDDRQHMENMLEYFCDIREPLQLLMFPEGTDLTDNTRARSDEFAQKNGLPKYEYVLHPRTTGFTFIVDTLRKAQVTIWTPSTTSRWWPTRRTSRRQSATWCWGCSRGRSTSTCGATRCPRCPPRGGAAGLVPGALGGEGGAPAGVLHGRPRLRRVPPQPHPALQDGAAGDADQGGVAAVLERLHRALLRRALPLPAAARLLPAHGALLPGPAEGGGGLELLELACHRHWAGGRGQGRGREGRRPEEAVRRRKGPGEKRGRVRGREGEREGGGGG